MDDLFFVAPFAFIYAAAVVIPSYLILVVSANLIYRLAAGRFFRWASWRTALPFFALLLGVWGFCTYALLDSRAFAITH